MSSQVQEHFCFRYQWLRPYHVECTGSRPITEVKQRRALVSTWMGDRLGTPGVVVFLSE